MPTIKEIDRLNVKMIEEENRIENLGKELNEEISVGLDLSKSCPGIAVVNLAQNKLILTDNLKAKSGRSNYLSFYRIKEWLNEIIKVFKPKVFIVEAAFASRFGAKSNATLYKLHGYIGTFLISKGIEIRMIEPSASRAFLEIKPNKKEVAFEWAKEHFQEAMLTTFKKDNDKADAIILALNGHNKNTKEW